MQGARAIGTEQRGAALELTASAGRMYRQSHQGTDDRRPPVV